MVLDPSDYAVCIPVPRTDQLTYTIWKEYTDWAAANRIELQMAFGNFYLKNKEDAIMFRLKFDV